MQSALMDGERKILREIPVAGALRPYAYAVWEDTEGRVQMGPVRCRRVLAGRERLSEWAGESDNTYSCSPFPGAWSEVPEARILRVRHLGALSLHTMVCVCQGSEWDTPCPAPDCVTPARVR